MPDEFRDSIARKWAEFFPAEAVVEQARETEPEPIEELTESEPVPSKGHFVPSAGQNPGYEMAEPLAEQFEDPHQKLWRMIAQQNQEYYYGK